MKYASKICLITGATSGLGKEIALALALAGNHLILVCRNRDKGELVRQEILTKSNVPVDLMIADLSSQNDIRSLVTELQKNYVSIDILINNAALVSRKQLFSIDNIEMTLATNFLAPFLLTNSLLDMLRKSSSARIINISSAVHRWGKIDLNDLQYKKRKYQFMKAYAQSKLLLNIYSFELARRLKGSKITVNCVHPGAVKTNLGSDSADNMFLRLLDKLIKFFFITPAAAAITPVHLACSAEVNGISGKYFVKGKAVKASARSYNAELSKSVWLGAQKLVGR